MNTAAIAYPLAPFTRFGTAFGWGLRRTLGARKFLITGVLALGVGIGLSLLMSLSRDPVFNQWEMLDQGLLGVAVPLIALALVGGGFGEEIQDRTLVFHLVRPVSRSTMFFARYAAGVVPAATTAAAMLVGAALAGQASLSATTVLQLGVLGALGATTVGALYYALAALFRRGLIAGLVYTFVVEGFFQFLPGSIRKLSLMHHVRSVYHRWTDDAFASISSTINDKLHPRYPDFDYMDLARQAAARKEEPWTSVSGALLVCAGLVVATLWLGARSVSRKDFALKD